MRVVEVFGPTIQGEGPLAGRITHFLRLGGCDYRCSWCDSMHAVDPAQVRRVPDLNETEVCAALAELEPAPMLVISGGNPVLYKLDRLIELLRERYLTIALETQGSKWRNWVLDVDSIVVSPKPPSSEMVTPLHTALFEDFMGHVASHGGVALKVVVFDGDDLDYAGAVHDQYPDRPMYLSTGTQSDDGLEDVASRYAWLCETVARDPALHRTVVLPQLHVVAWGHRVGV